MSDEKEEPVEFVPERDVFGLEKQEKENNEIVSVSETDAVLKNESLPYSDYQPVWRFAVLYVLSLGIYQLYWYYHHWDLIRNKTGETFNPALRTLFIVIFGYPFFRRVKRMAHEKGYSGNPPMFLLFIFYIAAAVYGYYIPLVSLMNFVFLLPVLSTLNFYYLKEQQDRKIRKGLSPNEKIFLVIITCVNLTLLFLFTD